MSTTAALATATRAAPKRLSPDLLKLVGILLVGAVAVQLD